VRIAVLCAVVLATAGCLDPTGNQCGGGIVCPVGSACTAAGSSTPGHGNETVTFSAQAGKTYYFVVDGFASNSGAFHLGVSCP
jgi:hypothetical protein